jgi:hypothetical protein
MKRRPVGVWALLVVVAAVQGCQNGAGSGRSLTVSPTPFSLDIPVPSGFRLRSHSDDTPGGSTTHEYIGWATRESLRDFYRSEMPLVRWRAVDNEAAEVADDRYLLLFDRGDETCRISIRSAGVFSFGRAVVVAQMAPRAGAVDVE